jgi:hypothetical protein
MNDQVYETLATLATALKSDYGSSQPQLSASNWRRLALFDAFTSAGVPCDQICGPEFVGHYGRLESIYNVFQLPFHKTLFASVPDYLNDIDELASGFKIWQSVCEASDRDHSDFVTIASFSGDIDSAYLWLSYGEKGAGACLEIRRYYLFSLPDVFSGPVIYDVEAARKFINVMGEWFRLFRDIAPAEQVAGFPSLASAFVKDSRFQFESEFRVVAGQASRAQILGSRLRAVYPIQLVGPDLPSHNTAAMNTDVLPFPEEHDSIRIRIGPCAANSLKAMKLSGLPFEMVVSEIPLRQ